MSQNLVERCSTPVDGQSEAIIDVNSRKSTIDLETIFHAQYERISRVIAGVIRDRARAEELAVEVFLKWSRTPKAHGDNAEGWLYRTAVRTALNELRREARRSRYEALFRFDLFRTRRRPPTPEDHQASKEEQDRVRLVLSSIRPHQAELLLLRNDGLSYTELAAALELNPASIGMLLSRAEKAFRREYIKRYGQ